MFITPNSTVQLYEGVPFDKEYRHTAYFATRAAQNDYFGNHLEGWTLSNYTFLKEDKSISVGLDSTITYQVVSQCNYLRFKNTAYFNKWFYAFIDRVEWINNGNAKVFFTIDVMQTWLPNVDYDFEQCYVEREHAYRDRIGDNLIPENLPLGDYIFGDEAEVSWYNPDNNTLISGMLFNEYVLIVAISKKVTMTRTLTEQQTWSYTFAYADNEPLYYGKNNVSALYYFVFDNSEQSIIDFRYFMEDISREGMTEEIFSIFWYPKAFISHFLTNTTEIPVFMWTGTQFDYITKFYLSVPSYFGYSGDPNTHTANIDGYVPKNKKLFTYPFNYLSVITPDGEELEYKYERFTYGTSTNYTNGGVCQFETYGAVSPTPVIQIYPRNYRNGGAAANSPQSIVLSNYPNVAYNVDVAKAASAQMQASYLHWTTAAKIGVNALTGAIGGAMSDSGNAGSGALSGAISGAASVANSIFSDLQRIQALKVAPDRTKGTPSSPTLLQSGMMRPIFINKHVTAEFAKIADDYFTMFGYACKLNKVPSIHNRSAYTYVKTTDAHLRAQNMPHDMEEAICTNLNNGITFWVDPADMGDYSVTNTPLGGN